MLITVFNHVQSDEHLRDSYALYRTDVNAVDYMSTTGRSQPDSYAFSDRCERRRLHVDHRAFTARPDTYYKNNVAFFSGALPHQSSHCAATQMWVSVVECGEPVQHPECQLVTMQLPGNHCDQNLILISTSALHWAVIIGKEDWMKSQAS